MKHSLLENLYIKRFCLPCDTDITKLISSFGHKSLLVTSNSYNHIAFVFEQGKIVLNNNELFMTKTDDNIISYGINSYGDTDGKHPGIHAEIDAINRLPNFRNKHNAKHNKQINLFITRISKIAKIQNSKPCNSCIQKMKYLSNLKGYKIRRIYYTDDIGNIVRTNLENLELEPQHYSLYYRNKQLRI
jgi:hypothetical protein